MASINLRELRNTVRLKAWLRDGEVVELRERDTVLARIVPVRQVPDAVARPRFAERARATFGDTVFAPGSIRRERDRY